MNLQRVATQIHTIIATIKACICVMLTTSFVLNTLCVLSFNPHNTLMYYQSYLHDTEALRE
jgi:hypothetical protein